MAGEYGFVYILTNEHMPNVFKLGCTERSPHQRADELSKPTGIPAGFKVLCFIEAPDFQSLERRVHGWLDAYRINPSREFFDMLGIKRALSLLYWHNTRLSFCDQFLPQEPPRWLMLDPDYLDGIKHLDDLPDPYEPPTKRPASIPFDDAAPSKEDGKLAAGEGSGSLLEAVLEGDDGL